MLPSRHEDNARGIVKTALDNNIAFYAAWQYDALTEEQKVDIFLDHLGCKIIGGHSPDVADYGRAKTGRTMPV